MSENNEDQNPDPGEIQWSAIKHGEFNGKIYRNYKIIEPIGQGKFSFVFKALDQNSGKFIALKLLKIFDMNDVKQRDNCIKEVKLMEKLSHPNITQYIESFIQDNEMFIAVEWAAKGDLKAYVQHTKRTS